MKTTTLKNFLLYMSLLFVSSLNLQAQCFPDGNGLDFDGIDDRISVTSSISNNIFNLTNITVECWVYRTDNNARFIVSKYLHSAASGGYWLKANWDPTASGGGGASGGRVTFAVGSNDQNWRWVSNSASNLLPMNTWTHVAATYDGTRIKLYFNGVDVSFGPLGASYGNVAPYGTLYTGGIANTTTMPFEIGQRSNFSAGSYNTSNTRFKGKLDELRVWSVARSQANIVASMNSNLTSGTDLVASYSFNHGVANLSNFDVTTLNDAVNSVNNGTLYGFDLNGNSSNWVSSLNTGITSTTSTGTCGQGSVTLTAAATTSPSYTLSWYDSPSGGSALATGLSYTIPSLTATTTYYVQVGTGTCASTNRIPVLASIYTPASITTQNLNQQQVCLNTSPTPLTVVASGGGLSYQWYSNNSQSTTGGQLISGATSPSYSPPTNALGTKYYYCVVTGNCAPLTATSNVSGAFTVVGSVAGTIQSPSTGFTACVNEEVYLELTGHNGSVQWQYAPLTTNPNTGATVAPTEAQWTNFSGGTSAEYDAVMTSSVKHIRSRVTDGTCAAATTNYITGTLYGLPAVGTISGPSAVCSGSTASLTLSGTLFNNHYRYWQKASSPTGPWTNINGATAATITTQAITATTYFRAEIYRNFNGYCSNYSAVHTVAVYAPLGSIGNISGPSYVTSGSVSTFSTPSVSGATSYVWDMPAGLSIASSSNGGATVVVNASNFVGGTIKVKALNACGGGETIWRTRYVNAPAQTAVNITTTHVGAPVICGGSVSVPFSMPSAVGATYSWTLPAGLSYSSGSIGNEQTIYVDFSSGYVGGAITCVRTTSSATNTSSYNVGGMTSPTSITGATVLCNASTATYSIDLVQDATSYEWQLPIGMIGSSTSESITVSITGAVNGAVKVRSIGACGTSLWRSLTVGAVARPSVIAGPTMVCGAATYTIGGSSMSQVSQNTFNYSVTNVAGTTYTWTVPTGMSISSGQGTNAILVSVNASTFNTGVLSVVASSNGCTSSSRRLTITKTASTITGPTGVCGLTTATYSVPAGSGSAYNWSIPSWMTITSGQGTNSINVSIAATGTAVQNISVVITTDCGNVTLSRSVGCSLYTQLTSTYINATLPSLLNAGVLAINLTGATAYMFEVTNVTTNQTTTLESADRLIRFDELSGITIAHAMTYSIRVRAKLSGQWGSYGTSYNVYTPAIPTTELTSTYCGEVLTTMVNPGILANNVLDNYVSIASAFKFEVKDMSTNTVYELESVDRWIGFNELVGLVLGYDQDFEVRVKIKTINNAWGSYGNVCIVNTPPNPIGLAQQDPQLHEEQSEGIQTEEITNATETTVSLTQTTETSTWSATTTSNPFEHSFKVNLNGAEAIENAAMFTATLTDMSGKVYTNQTLSKEPLTEENFGQDLAPGMYLLTLRQGEEWRMLRVVKR